MSAKTKFEKWAKKHWIAVARSAPNGVGSLINFVDLDKERVLKITSRVQTRAELDALAEAFVGRQRPPTDAEIETAKKLAGIYDPPPVSNAARPSSVSLYQRLGYRERAKVRSLSLTIPCPDCKAEVGQFCKGCGGGKASAPHLARRHRFMP